MNDKTAIETIRALKRNAENDMPEYDYGWDAAIDEAIKALAALDAEKPGEDASSVVEQINDAMASVEEFNREELNEEEARNEWERRWREKASILIQHFAASYHAEQCKACPCGRLGIYLKEEVYLCTRPKQDCHARSNGLCLNALRCLPLPEAPIV